MHRARGHTAVMAYRLPTPPDDLEFFPTAPWASRALLARLAELEPGLDDQVAWEPACGQLHMALALADRFRLVLASDVFDYGVRPPDCDAGARIQLLPTMDFLGAHPPLPCAVDWIWSNPPFRPSLAFALKALEVARRGVALFIRIQWLEGDSRFHHLFSRQPPEFVAVHVERVALHKGVWRPHGSTASGYAWAVWRKGHEGPTRFEWLPPGQKRRHHRESDLRLPHDLRRKDPNAVRRAGR